MSTQLDWRVLIIVLGVLQAGCSSVPLGTLWKLSRIGPEALYEANPEEVRAAVKSAEWFLEGPSFDQGVLLAELRSALHGDRSWKFTLEETSAREAWQLPEPSVGQRWRIYRIAEAELAEFPAFQRIFSELIDRSRAEDDEGGFSLSVRFANDEQETARSESATAEVVSRTETVEFRIDLKLAAEDGYFTLVNDHEMDVQMQERTDADAE